MSIPDVEIALGRMMGGKAKGKDDISVVIPVTEDSIFSAEKYIGGMR
jgi:hypothetical protein